LTQFERLRAALDASLPPFPENGDWDDVLRRAGRVTSGSRLRKPRTAAAALAAFLGVVALLAAPALGLGDRLRALVGSWPGDSPVLFSAELSSRHDAGTGSFTVRISRLNARRPGGRPLRLFKPPFRWTLTHRGVASRVTSAHIHAGKRSYTLCAPCASPRATGTLDRRGLGLLETAAGRAVVDVHTLEHPEGALRGRVEARIRRAP
jgi:CHRD domain